MLYWVVVKGNNLTAECHLVGVFIENTQLDWVSHENSGHIEIDLGFYNDSFSV
ncbi:hypothetical protein KO493_02510 [Tamlana agarivorans]|uniref:Uncharacterized protein n=1 Tax=Pseudotamlana agarivorans TaxID=481183 RepID=A0ACC5U5J1_9FLAO|nr:hypothetical protein [Tamlana agarivorans]MBU2949565.1 hypothetical protein [Tamlana agarivorans]